jgi:TonB family protein
MLIFVILLTACTAFAQEGNSQPSILKQCNQFNPPPCADSLPKVKFAPDPEYPKEARKKKVEGTVELSLVVGVDGRTSQVRVARSAGYGFDEKAMDVVKKWRFAPGAEHGTPCAVQINIEVSFRLY